MAVAIFKSRPPRCQSGCLANLKEVQIPKTIMNSPETPIRSIFVNGFPVSSSNAPKSMGNRIQIRLIVASVLFRIFCFN